jgi:hypothetical protein
LGITAGIGTGIGGISSSIYTYQKLSAKFNNDIEQVTQPIEALQDQVDSPASVVLQNRRALDLLTAEKGGTCLFLNEECCFYANKSGVVRDMARQLKERVTKRKEELANSWSFWKNLWAWVLGHYSGWPTFYALSNTPIWASYNKCSLQIHISTGPEDQTPAFSQGVLTSAYA